VSALRFLEHPIADDQRRRAFAVAAAALLLAGVVLSLTASDPAGRPSAPSQPPRLRPDDSEIRQPAREIPADVLSVARRFVDDYLDRLYGGQRRQLRGASATLRRQLLDRPVRVSPAMRRQRPRVEGIDGQQLDDGWLIDAEITAATVSFSIAVVVVDRPGGPVVTRLVED
jgi:hypothetical protein